MNYVISSVALLAFAAGLSGCGETSTPDSAVSATTASINGDQFLLADEPELRRLLDEVQARELDPLSAVREILEKVYGIGDDGRPDAR